MLNAELSFAKNLTQKNIDKTLQEITQQQQSKLTAVISELLVQHQQVLQGIVAQSGKVTAPILESPLSYLLIKDKLLSPLNAVMQREQSFDLFLSATSPTTGDKDEENI